MAEELSLVQLIVDEQQLNAMSLDELAENINEGYYNASITARKLAIDIARIGAMLSVAQMKCREQEIVWCNRDGEGWLKDNSPDISRTTAYRYIRIYKQLKEQVDGVSLMRNGDIMEEETDEIAIRSLPVTNAYIALGILPAPPKVTEGATSISSRDRMKALQLKIEQLHNKIAELEALLTEEQKSVIERIAQQKQSTFENIVREAIDIYLEQFENDE